MNPFVYGLVDPLEPKHVRYVGMTRVRVSRPFDHSRLARNEIKHSHLFHWIRSLHAEGREPSILLLEELSENSSRWLLGFVEKCYIKSLREIGHRLTNVAEGGEGGNVGDYTHSEESRRRGAEALRRYFKDPKNQAVLVERNARQSETKIVQWRDPERRRRHSEVMTGKTHVGVPHSEETKKVLSDAMHSYYEDPKNQTAIEDRNTRRAQTKASRPKVVMSKESNGARSKAHTGCVKSEATRAAMSAAAKERERKKREKKND